MRDLQRISALYLELDALLEGERTEALASGDSLSAARIEQKLVVNDQAYFVLCWGQLEVEIDEKCRNAIRSRLSGGTWETRRAWDLFNPEDKRLSGLTFQERTALTLDQNAGTGSPWSRVMFYYGLRNRIAHGTLASTRIDVASIVREFYIIQSALRA
jgi:hypothetical protein